MKKIVFLLAILSIGVIVCKVLYSNTKYDYPLNTIETIKYFEPVHKQYAYHALSLTPTEYSQTPFSNTLTAKAVYKDQIIGIKIKKSRTADKITFKSIGKESDNFVKAIAELYEENVGQNTTMRPQMEGLAWNGETGFVNWHKQDDCYKLSMTALNGKVADMYLDIMVPKRIVSIGDKNGGLSKKRFVDAFRAN